MGGNNTLIRESGGLWGAVFHSQHPLNSTTSVSSSSPTWSPLRNGSRLWKPKCPVLYREEVLLLDRGRCPGGIVIEESDRGRKRRWMWNPTLEEAGADADTSSSHSSHTTAVLTQYSTNCSMTSCACSHFASIQCLLKALTTLSRLGSVHQMTQRQKKIRTPHLSTESCRWSNKPYKLILSLQRWLVSFYLSKQGFGSNLTNAVLSFLRETDCSG